MAGGGYYKIATKMNQFCELKFFIFQKKTKMDKTRVCLKTLVQWKCYYSEDFFNSSVRKKEGL
jgi:hypothetical protein